MALKPKPEIRAVKKALHEALHKQRLPGDPKENAKVEARLLKQANEHIAERKAQADKNIADYSWEAASYVRNRARGQVMVLPSMSEEFRKGFDKIDWGHRRNKIGG
uniref:Uncharacterized protein n=1 Tax=viral metagenome TaxID=1070528 RepID=A0A6H1ZS44_9ZZZZ